jgi:hypothetical protein
VSAPLLTNTSNYLFYAIAYGNDNIPSPKSIPAFGVPANLNTISDANLTVNRGGGPNYTPSGLTASWTNSLSTGASYVNSTQIDCTYKYYALDSASQTTTNESVILYSSSKTITINSLNYYTECIVELRCRIRIPVPNRPYWAGLSEDGYIDQTPTISATVFVQNVPQAVTDIDAFSGLTSTGMGSIQVTWKGDEADTSYNLTLYSTSPWNNTNPNILQQINVPTAENYTFTGLAPGGLYWVSIIALNIIGAGPQTTYPTKGYPGIYVIDVPIPTPTILCNSTSIPGYIEVEVTLPALSSGSNIMTNATLLYLHSDLYVYREDGSTTNIYSWNAPPAGQFNIQTSSFTYTYSYQVSKIGNYTFGAKSMVSGTSGGIIPVVYESMVGFSTTTYTTDPLITNYIVANNAITCTLSLNGNTLSGIQTIGIPSNSSASAQIVSVPDATVAGINLNRFTEQTLTMPGPSGMTFDHSISVFSTIIGKSLIASNICDS